MQRLLNSGCQPYELMTDERRLIQDCLKGKLSAQRELYEKYAGSMLGVCFRYTRSLPDAEDVLQEAFVKVFNKLSQFKFEGELGGWIRRIMVTTALNYLKKNKRYQTEMYFTEEYMHPVTNDNPEINIEAKEIANLIRQLPQGYQVIFNLHAVEGYSHVEIGQILGISDSTSRSQYARARAVLISWIKALQEERLSDNEKLTYVGK